MAIKLCHKCQKELAKAFIISNDGWFFCFSCWSEINPDGRYNKYGQRTGMTPEEFKKLRVQRHDAKSEQVQVIAKDMTPKKSFWRTLDTDDLPPWLKETFVSFILLATLGGMLLFLWLLFRPHIYQTVLDGDFFLRPSDSMRGFEKPCVNLMPLDAIYNNVKPIKIDVSPFINVRVTDAYQSGFYINGGWSPRSKFKYFVSAARNAPEGKYRIKIFFPVYTFTTEFRVVKELTRKQKFVNKYFADRLEMEEIFLEPH